MACVLDFPFPLSPPPLPPLLCYPVVLHGQVNGDRWLLQSEGLHFNTKRLVSPTHIHTGEHTQQDDATHKCNTRAGSRLTSRTRLSDGSRRGPGHFCCYGGVELLWIWGGGRGENHIQFCWWHSGGGEGMLQQQHKQQQQQGQPLPGGVTGWVMRLSPHFRSNSPTQ